MLRYILAWLPMIPIAIMNGILREKTYGQRVSELRAHQISSLTGILLLGTYIGPALQILGLASPQQALAIGLIWLGMTIIFEFVFGHYVAKQPWRKLLHDYNLRQGRVWVLVLLWVAIAPLIFYYQIF